MSTPTFNPALATMARGEGVEIGGVEHLEALEQIVANAVGHGHMAGMYRPAAAVLIEIFGPLILRWVESRLEPPPPVPPAPEPAPPLPAVEDSAKIPA